MSDAALDQLKNARNSPSVAKLELAKLKAYAASLPVFVFEGDDDKIIYSQWINRKNSQLRYAMLPCSGKGPVLSLRRSLTDDRTNLARQVYFFVDRDFDDLRGQPEGPDVFMTTRYAVENYLVDESVLAQALDIEFHCHLAHETKDKILTLFRQDYDRFLDISREVNRRLFIARRLGIEIRPLPTGVGKLASVALGAVNSGTNSPTEAVVYLSEPAPADVTRLSAEFDQMNPRERYRGKFALLFFNQWLRKLSEQKNLPDRGVFSDSQNKTPFRVAELTLTNFASRCSSPEGLDEFLASVPETKAA